MAERPIISEEYRRLQRELHDNRESYGTASLQFAPVIKAIIEDNDVRSVSDYGAGKCNLKVGLERIGVENIDYYPYDPAYPEYGAPRPADLVVCVDVLEHIEEPYLENVLRDLNEITVGIGYLTIHTGPARKVLPDGRNAHLIQKPSSWWLPRLCAYFEILKLEPAPYGFGVVVERIGREAPSAAVLRPSARAELGSSAAFDLATAARTHADERRFAEAVALYARLFAGNPEADDVLKIKRVNLASIRLRYAGCLRKVGDKAGVARELGLIASSPDADPSMLLRAADLALTDSLEAELSALLQAAEEGGAEAVQLQQRRVAWEQLRAEA